MSKKRLSKNKGYPKGWRLKNGAIRYRVPAGQEHLWDNKSEFTLGKTETEAYKVWVERLQLNEDTFFFSELLDRYLYEVVPEKAYSTQYSNRIAIKNLRPVFGDMPITSLKPKHAYEYMDKTAKKRGKTAANHDYEVISHAYTKAVQWGLIDSNPFIGNVKKIKTSPRDRYIEDWEINEILALKPKIKSRSVALIKLFIRLVLMTGLTRIDILQLKLSDLKEDGIHFQRQKTNKKTGKRFIIEWGNGELKSLIEEIKSFPPHRIGNAHLFVTRQCKPYYNPETMKCNAFDSSWQRFRKRVMELTDITEHFTEHDLRAKVASDSDTLEEASARMTHSSSEITKRVYRRKAEKFSPLERKIE